ncbi:MAG: phosphoribosyltransferase family protein [Candidatus Bathyarchaeia archaeon]
MLKRKNSIVYDEDLLGKYYVFRDRFHAGEELGKACLKVLDSSNWVLAIPMGGIPIGIKVSKILSANFDILICRKLLIPWNREDGFGAVDPDGRYFIDEEFASSIGLSRKDIEEAVKEQINEIKTRNMLLRSGREYPSYNSLRVVLVDDGIAAGYTMMAAINFVKSRGASGIIVASPTGNLNSLLKLSRSASTIICLNIRSGPWFAVADAYESWRDIGYEEALNMLREELQGL